MIRTIESFCTTGEIMTRALIVSNHAHMTHRICERITRMGWCADSISMEKMIGHDSNVLASYPNLLVAVDNAAYARFSGVTQEIGAILRNCAAKTSLYLLFESTNDLQFSLWVAQAKRSYNKMSDNHHFQRAMDNIIKEMMVSITSSDAVNACISPSGVMT